MTSILQRGAEFLSQNRHSSASVEVVYTRSGEDPVTLQATPGRPRGDQSDVNAVALDADRVDFIIRREDLVIDGSETDPIVGDTIELTYGGKTRTYTVERDELDKAWIVCDEFGKDIRVHTIAGSES